VTSIRVATLWLPMLPKRDIPHAFSVYCLQVVFQFHGQFVDKSDVSGCISGVLFGKRTFKPPVMIDCPKRRSKHEWRDDGK